MITKVSLITCKRKYIFKSGDFFIKIDLENDFGLSAGYEQSKFRTERLAEILMDVLPDFALKHSELIKIPRAKIVEKMRKSARLIYQTKKFKRRGEFGELILHLVLRDFYKTIPAISKIYYKDSANDTVKGFDAVHVSIEKDKFQLWLGESKIYKNPRIAIRSILKDLKTHLKPSFMRNEFMFIQNKIDSAWPHKKKLEKLISENKSIDSIFEKLVLVGIVSYDSKVTSGHMQVTPDFKAAIEAELKELSDYFRSNKLPNTVEIRLAFIPLKSKLELITILDTKLKAMQSI